MKRRHLFLSVVLISCLVFSFTIFPCFAADSTTTADDGSSTETTEAQNTETDTETETNADTETETDQTENDSDSSTTQSSSGSSSETQSSSSEESSSEGTSDTAAADETDSDPLLNRITEDFESSSSSSTGISLFSASYTSNSRFVMDKELGIDVSVYQGDIDWTKVRAAGIDFVYVRIGGSYTVSGNHFTDSKGISNIQGAQAAGLKVGAYYFSQCTSNDEAASEAEYAVNILEKNDISLDLPLIMDYEYADGSRMYSASNMTKSDMTSYVMTFCQTVSDAGYQAGLYANYTMLSSKLNGATIADSYYVWLANWINYDYETMSSYSNAYDYWQYSDCGTVDGISGEVDLDVMISSRRTMASVFDADYYLANNSDVESALGTDPDTAFDHFLRCGMSEGRQAIESFNVYAYANRYPDLQKAYGDDLPSYYLHYIYWGEAEGRDGSPYTDSDDLSKNSELEFNLADTVSGGLDYSPVFNGYYYLNKYADLKAAYGDDQQAAFEHFIKWGMSEGRQAIDSFNVYAYANRYADLQKAYGNDLPSYYLHYIKWGESEGRDGSPYTDSDDLSKNSELEFNWADTVSGGLDYSPVFNGYYYLNKYADLKAAYGDDQQKAFTHFLKWGMKEGRQACESFNVKTYRARYADLNRAYGSNLAAYYLHYLKWGISEGRSGASS